MGKKGQNKIPERWEKYSKIGNRIPGTNFICFKVPLKEEMCRYKTAITKAEWFTPADLVSEIARQGYTLGILIDLTNTDRYYDPSTVTYTGTEYVKVNVTGQDLPSLREVKGFFQAVDDFEQQLEHKQWVDGIIAGDKLIGVHCTHGVNRTGYMVCQYLIQRKGWSAKKAIHEFNKARGHQMEREHYLAALFQAERTLRATKQTNMDTEPIEDQSSSSSSSDDEPVVERPAVLSTVEQAPALPLSAPAPLPGWQLFQQMMMGVAQMQAMMRMPFAGVPSEGQAASAGDEGDSSEEEDEEEESDEEDGEEEDSSNSGEEEKSTKSDEQAGPSREGWELGGKVELRPKMTRAQKRRVRRRNLRDEFKKMRKGKFWEIREMQKEKYGI